DETFFLNLSNPTNASTADNQGTGTILNDDGSLLVNTTADTTISGDGLTSLREAITYANSHAGADTITFDPTVFAAPGPYTLQLASALPTLSGDVDIQGPSAKLVTVRGQGAANPYRIFFVGTG